MAGRGPLPSTEVSRDDPDILALTEDLNWEVARDPLHFDKPGGAGVGPGLSFARALRVRHPDWRIGLIPTAVGGSPLDQWQPGASLLEAALARARAAAPAGQFAGVIWHQGENDSRFPEKAATYGERLNRTIDAFRGHLELPQLPFVAGELGPFLADNVDPGFPALATILATIRSLPQCVPFTAVAGTEGLGHLGDHVHLDTPSQVIFGRRYAAAYLGLVGG